MDVSGNSELTPSHKDDEKLSKPKKTRTPAQIESMNKALAVLKARREALAKEKAERKLAKDAKPTTDTPSALPPAQPALDPSQPPKKSHKRQKRVTEVSLEGLSQHIRKTIDETLSSKLQNLSSVSASAKPEPEAPKPAAPAAPAPVVVPKPVAEPQKPKKLTGHELLDRLLFGH